jgi:hypothetical protein
MTHPLGLFWRMTPFPEHLEPAFILVWARGQGYGWLLGHLLFILHRTFYFQLNILFLFQFNSALGI